MTSPSQTHTLKIFDLLHIFFSPLLLLQNPMNTQLIDNEFYRYFLLFTLKGLKQKVLLRDIIFF